MISNFLGIGTQRAATTWLFNCLNEHPEIFVPENKELSFFDIHYEKGFAYYCSFFRNAKGYKAIGEISPDYLYIYSCPERIATHLPKIKMIVILRNPIERAFSYYEMFVKNKSGWSFEDSIKRKPYILEKGLYYEQLKRYFAFFDRNQFIILLYEDLVNDNLRSIRLIYKFLNVDDNFIPSWIGKSSNPKAFQTMRNRLKSLHAEWIIELVKKSPLHSTIRSVFAKGKRKSKHKINPRTQYELLEYYRKPNQELEQLIGQDLSFWNS